TWSPAVVSGSTRVRCMGEAESLSSSRLGPETSARTGPTGRTTVRPAGGRTVTSTGTSALAGSSAAARNQRNTDRPSDVSLRGRSAKRAPRRVTSSAGLAEQALDQGAVGGRVPVVRADDALDDDPAAVEQEALGHAGGLVGLLDARGAVLQQVEAQLELAPERAHVVGAALVGAHRGDGEAARRQRGVEPLHGGHLDAAGD